MSLCTWQIYMHDSVVNKSFPKRTTYIFFPDVQYGTGAPCNGNRGQRTQYEWHFADVLITPVIIISALQIELQWSCCKFLWSVRALGHEFQCLFINVFLFRRTATCDFVSLKAWSQSEKKSVKFHAILKRMVKNTTKSENAVMEVTQWPLVATWLSGKCHWHKPKVIGSDNN